MNEISEEASAVGLASDTPGGARGILQAFLLAIPTGFLYYRILGNLVSQWWHDSHYSYGFFVPLFCAWIVWRERNRLANTMSKPHWSGLLVVIGALGILTLGVIGAEDFLSRTSLLFLIAGLIVYFRGWAYFRTLLFPWGILFLMIPLPAVIFNQIALPLQFQASKLASGLLSLVGVPVLREGNVIHLPSLTLDVVEACSGLRSLASLIALAVFYGYLFERNSWARVLLILSAIPIAVVSNGCRIMGSAILGEYWDADKAQGFFHLFSGWLVFMISLALLVGLHAAFSWLFRRTNWRQA